MRRRNLLRTTTAIGLVGVGGCIGDSSEVDNGADLTGEYVIESFIERNGSDLVLDGETYTYNGMMALLTHTDSRMQNSWTNQAMSIATQRNIDVFRVYGYPAPWDDVAQSTHSAPGEFDDRWFQQFDYTVAKAKEEGIRLIVPLLLGPLVNPEREGVYAPSPAQYGLWADSTDYETWPDDFIDNEEATGYFKEYIEHFLTRENVYTGVEYRNEPTILAWECANELEYKGEDKDDYSIAFWYQDIASYIKSLAPNHLVGTGMHGSMGEIYEPWTERTDFVTDHQVDEIDLCSIHMYPVRSDQYSDRFKTERLVKRFLNHKLELAHNEIGKPLYVGEYGTSFNPRVESAEKTDIIPTDEAEQIRSNHEIIYDEERGDEVLLRYVVDIEDDWDIEKRNEYFEYLADFGRANDLDGPHFWRLAKRTIDDTVEDRIEYSDLIVFPEDTSTLDVISEYGENR